MAIPPFDFQYITPDREGQRRHTGKRGENMTLKIIALCLACFSLGMSVSSLLYQELLKKRNKRK